MSQAPKQLVSDLVAAWNSHDLERVAAFYAPDYQGVDVGRAEPQIGQEGIRQMLAGYWNAFPDLEFTADDLLLQDDRITVLWTARGTHQGRLFNIPPTGQQVQVRGVSLLTLQGNRIRHALYIWDVAGLLRALGLLPDL